VTTSAETSPGADAAAEYCIYCEAALEPGPRNPDAPVCAAPVCERRRVQDAARAVFRGGWDDYVAGQHRGVGLAGAAIAQAVRLIDASPEAVAIGVVPHQNRALTPLPPDRRVEFEAHLDQLIAQAFAAPLPEPDPEPGRRARSEASEHPLIDATCATCQGLCCSLGGARMAFLQVADMQRFWQRHPAAEAPITPAAVRKHYLAHLPERSVEHACVYQGAAGCTLRREDRADVCNRYHCYPQTQLLVRMREMGTDKAVIIAHEGGPELVIAGFTTDAGLQRLPPAGPGRASQVDAPGPDQTERALAAALGQIPPPLG
jgi:hypothetical protein